MARGRMINQTIDFDPEFNALSIEAQLLYLRALAFLDRDGLIIGHPRALLAKVAPLLDMAQADMFDIIDEWVEQGLVIRYTIKVGDILFFKGFAKNQSGMHYDRESPSRFDPPPGWTYGPKGLVKIESGDTPAVEHEDVPSESGATPTEAESDTQTNSGTTPAELRQESGETPTQIEVKDQDQIQEQQDDEEDTPARDAQHQTWFDTYHVEMPPEIEKAIAKELKNCSEEAILYAIRVSVGATERTFNYLKSCALNYLPPPPISQNANYANGKSYQAEAHIPDIPGVVRLEPTGNAPPKPLPPMAHDDPWAVALAELAGSLPGNAPRWLEGSYLEENGELAGVPFYRVVLTVSGANAEWMQQQAEPAIRKKLASILGKRISLEFVVLEAEPTP